MLQSLKCRSHEFGHLDTLAAREPGGVAHKWGDDGGGGDMRPEPRGERPGPGASCGVGGQCSDMLMGSATEMKSSIIFAIFRS